MTQQAAGRRGVAVVDASVMITLLIDPSERGDRVGRLLAGRGVVAPALLPYEVVNVLRRRRLAGGLSDGEAHLALDSFRKIAIELWPMEVTLDRVWELRDNLSAYDAAYVALAEALGATLVTGDRRIARALGPSCPIRVV